jgi:hypothetical protein
VNFDLEAKPLSVRDTWVTPVFGNLSVFLEKLLRFKKRAKWMILAQVLLQMDNPEQLQYDQDHGNDDQCVNPTPSARQSWADVSTQKTE